jgi:hypothetical protein
VAKADKNKRTSEFLRGELNGKELEDFYNEIGENKELLEDLSEDIVKAYGRIKLKDRLELIHQETYRKQKIYFNAYFKIAASIIVVLGISFLIYFSFLNKSVKREEIVSVDSTIFKEKVNIIADDTVEKVNDKATPLTDDPNNYIADIPSVQNRNNQEIFAAYFSQPKAPMYRGAEDKLDSAFVLYQQEKYQEASVLFNEALKKLNNNTQINEALFYRGICILASDSTKQQLELARKLLNAVYIDEKAILKEEAGWYLSLLYIKADEVKKAKDILIKIVDEKSFNSPHAVILLKEL